jgi:hypothetical protein
MIKMNQILKNLFQILDMSVIKWKVDGHYKNDAEGTKIGYL